jgi:ABC-type branched-subunit amino acid transport system substrate-binding protein
VQPLSTGITFALTEKAPVDKIPVITAGYGRSESQDGSVFGWNFPLVGTYWMGADVLVQHIAKKEGSAANLKGKKIALVYHDSPFGKEPIALLQERAKMHGFDLSLLPVAHPGVEQKATWLQIRQNKPDYVFLWGWGVMNSTSLKEAQATGYPREKMYGIWWAGAEPDVKDVGDGAKGYNALAMQHGAEPNSKVVKEVLEKLHAIERVYELVVRYITDDPWLPVKPIHCPAEESDVRVVVLVVKGRGRVLNIGVVNSSVDHLVWSVLVILRLTFLPHIIRRIPNDHSDWRSLLTLHSG